jgi:protease secretion system outer membrane protein
MKRLTRLLVLGMVIMGGAPFTLQAEPLNLTEAYNKAMDYDARIRVARADNLAYREEIGKARAQLRPTLRASFSRGRNTTESDTPGLSGMVNRTQSYNSFNYAVSVRQPLLNLSNIVGYQQSKAIVAQSDSQLEKESSTLIIRIVEAYCNALFAEDSLSYSKAHSHATKEQHQQAQLRYEKGFGTITEINEAKAAWDMARADEEASRNSVEFNRRELERLIGYYPDELCRLQSEKIVLREPEPTSVDAWIEMGRSSNPSIMAASHQIEAARKEVLKQRVSRYPTIDLVAGRSYSQSDNNYTIGSSYDTYYVSLQANVPLYMGGYTSSMVRQAKARRIKAEEQLSMEERQAESDVRKYYNSILSSIAQIKAYEQAEKAEAIALTGTEKGFKAGLRSNVDVLTALQKYYDSKRSLAKARYEYILNRFLLKDATGTLSADDVEELNGWFN